ncbi:hypothetical protein V3F56_03075 [Moorellaceae bacterium AZ2]
MQIIIGSVLYRGIENFTPDLGRAETYGTAAAEWILALANILSGMIGVFAFLALILAGYMYVLSCGEEKKTEAAKKLTGAAVGAVAMVVLARLIAQFLLSLF